MKVSFLQHLNIHVINLSTFEAQPEAQPSDERE